MKHLTPDEDRKLRDTLKRCPPSTYEAARDFLQTRNIEHLHAFVLGVMERYVEREVRSRLRDASGHLRLAEDLGLDSLTMMEIVMLVEEVLAITIDNEQLRDLRTLDDLTRRLVELLAAAGTNPRLTRGAAQSYSGGIDTPPSTNPITFSNPT